MNKLHFLHQVIHLIHDLFFPRNFSRSAASQFGHNEGKRTLGIICACSDDFDWEGVKKPNIPQSEFIIYEMHVRQFIKYPNANVSEGNHGTYAGIIDKIDYLKDLGITAIELKPIGEIFPACSPLPTRIN